MEKVYHRDDFAVTIRLRAIDREGNTVDVGVPPFDWGARLFTPGSPRFVAISQKDGVAQGWTPADDGGIRVHLDRHGLWPGRLMAEFAFALPGEGYPDGSQRMVRKYDLGVELTADARDVPTEMAAEVDVPWQLIKGDQGESAVLGRVELVTDRATYELPLCGEPVTVKPHDAGGGSGWYGSGWYGVEWPLWGVWDIDSLN